MTDGETATQRLDLWLYRARFFKSRTLAARLVRARKVRVNGRKAAKASSPVAPGETLTFPQGGRIRIIRVLALPARRGPAAEAAALYEDLTPRQGRLKTKQTPGHAARKKGAGRPTKKDRRRIVHLKGGI